MDSYIKIPDAMAAMAQAIKKYVDRQPFVPIIETEKSPKVDGVFTLTLPNCLKASIIGFTVYGDEEWIQNDENNDSYDLMFSHDNKTFSQKITVLKKWIQTDSAAFEAGYSNRFKASGRNSAISYQWTQENGDFIETAHDVANEVEGGLDKLFSVVLYEDITYVQCAVPFSITYQVKDTSAYAWQEQITKDLNEEIKTQNELLTVQNETLLQQTSQLDILIQTLTADTFDALKTQLDAYLGE